MTSEQKTEFKEKIKNETLERLWAELEDQQFENVRQRIKTQISEMNDESFLKSYCRKIIVINYVKSQHINKIEHENTK